MTTFPEKYGTDISAGRPAEFDGRLRQALRLAAIALGLAQAWATRNTMLADGIAYLDMGDAFWRRDWHMAINGLWSPLYSWLLEIAYRILRPSSYWEFPVVHLVNFVIYLGALASFEFQLQTVIKNQATVSWEGEGRLPPLPEWAWYGIGYSIFLWTSLGLIGLGRTTPDLCVAAFFYLAAGFVLRIRSGQTSWWNFVGVGAALGVGYLAKAIMFPLASVFLGVALCAGKTIVESLSRTLMACIIFLAIGAPFFIPLSIFLGRATFGESGRLNYIWTVNRSDLGTPRHPMHKLHENPTVYEFAAPIKGTYPPWQDPTYWDAGLKAHFDLKNQIRVLKLTLSNYYNFLFLGDLGLIAAALILFRMSPLRASASFQSICRNWCLIVPALTGLAAFLLVKVEDRYIAPFVLLLWLGILSGLRFPGGEQSRKLLTASVAAIVITMGVPLLSTTFFTWIEARHTGPVDWNVAQALHQIGIEPGDRVALVRKSPWGDFFWARLAQVQVVAEIPPSDVDQFWGATQAHEDIYSALAGTGAKAIVASGKPPCADAGWQPLGATGQYAHLLTAPNFPPVPTTHP